MVLIWSKVECDMFVSPLCFSILSIAHFLIGEFFSRVLNDKSALMKERKRRKTEQQKRATKITQNLTFSASFLFTQQMLRAYHTPGAALNATLSIKY